MILHIPGPVNSTSTTICLHDIVRLETCTLEFFEKKIFNLYILIKAETDENFHLFSYVNSDKFKYAYLSLLSTIEQEPQLFEFVRIEPVSGVWPSPEKKYRNWVSSNCLQNINL